MVSAILAASSIVSIPLLAPGITGTPAFFISFFEVILLPISSITLPLGPTNFMSCFSHSSPKSEFSAKNPYPGCIASAPDLMATSIILSISK